MKWNELIKAIRKDEEMTQLEFSRVIEVSRSMIAQVETGKSNGDLYWIPMICYKLDLQIFYDPIDEWGYDRISSLRN